MVKDVSRRLHWGNAIAVIILTIIVGGCKTDAEYAGNGPLTLNTSTSDFLNKYLNDIGGITFAVSTNGRCSSYRVCRSGGTCREGDERYFAIQGCESLCKTTCKLLAVYRSIVWNGPVSGLPKAMQRSQDVP